MDGTKGTLYIVATPIGNLDDLSRRAERVLAEADYVAAEDTRRTRQMLTHLKLQKNLISYYEPREEKSLARIIEILEAGKSVALVTDGGTPGISDPGYRLVRAAHAAGIKVVPIPGPSALTAALSASGLPTDRVTFAGFLPSPKGARKKILEELAARRDTLVFFESPQRIVEMLAEAQAALGDREAVVFRELTKVYEEQVRGKLSEILAALAAKEVKGELTVVIHGSREREEFTEAEVRALLEDALNHIDQPLSELASALARETGWPRKKIYALALAIKKG